MIIGIAGYAGSGKDTFGQFLLELLPGYKRMAFADSLKDMLKDVAFITKADKEGMRPLYVELGKLGRRQDPNFWIKLLALKKVDVGEDIVITDVRYANEAKWILEHGGRVVYIEKPDVEPANDEELQSFTEMFSLNLLPHKIANYGTPRQLKITAEVFVQNMSNKPKPEEYRPYNVHELVDLVSQDLEIMYNGDKFTLWQVITTTKRENIYLCLATKFTMERDACEVRLNQKELLEKCTYPDGRKCGVKINA